MYSLFVLIPLLSIIVLNLPFRNAMRKAAFWWLAVLLACQAGAAAAFILGASGLFNRAFFIPAFGMGGQIDRLSGVLMLSIALVTGSALLAGSSSEDEERQFNFINLLLAALAGMNGIAIAADLFTLYVFIEVAAVASYILIVLYREKYALEAAFKYVILSSAASAMMLLSVGLVILVAGSTDFTSVRFALENAGRNPLAVLAVAMFVCGLFIKGGLMPFHGWLPGVYTSAPAPVSVLLAGIMTKALGIFTLIRLGTSAFVFAGPVREVLLLVGTLSIVAGALAALGQKDLKRMFAYSSISQVGYIIIGLGAGNPLGVAGAVFHLFNHSVFKSTLFLNSAALESAASTRDIERLGGLAQRMPVTASTSAIAWLSAAGIPPLAGFWSKLLIVVALWTAGHAGYAVLAVVASVLTLAYFLVMQRRVFSGHLREEFSAVNEASFGLLFPACCLSAITVAVGIAFPFIFKLIWR